MNVKQFKRRVINGLIESDLFKMPVKHTIKLTGYVYIYIYGTINYKNVPLKSAKFIIYNNNNEIVYDSSKTYRSYVSIKLEYGNYYFEEVESAGGCKIIKDKIYFSINADKQNVNIYHPGLNWVTITGFFKNDISEAVPESRDTSALTIYKYEAHKRFYLKYYQNNTLIGEISPKIHNSCGIGTYVVPNKTQDIYYTNNIQYYTSMYIIGGIQTDGYFLESNFDIKLPKAKIDKLHLKSEFTEEYVFYEKNNSVIGSLNGIAYINDKGNEKNVVVIEPEGTSQANIFPFSLDESWDKICVGNIDTITNLLALCCKGTIYTRYEISEDKKKVKLLMSLYREVNPKYQ